MLALPAEQSTTRHLASLYPFAGMGLGTDGVLIGVESDSGSPVRFDPFTAYLGEALTNPAMLVLGQIGRGKSAFVKSFLHRCLEGSSGGQARSAYVLDPKGEYGALAEALGLSHLTLAPRGRQRLNPLDPGASGMQGPELASRRAAMLEALSACGMGRELDALERAALFRVATRLPADAVLCDVVAMLTEPPAVLAAELHVGEAELRRSLRSLGLELARLVEGDLAGMLDGPTTLDPRQGPAGLVVDLSAIYRSPALAPAMVCVGAWLSAALAGGAGGRLLVLDEAWALLSEVAVARWLRATVKLARSIGTAVVLVTHRLSDLLAAGAEGTEAERIALGLVSDTEVRVLFGQSPDQAELARSLLGLSAAEAATLPRLGRGQALWRVGERRAVLDHVLTAFEERLCDTDAAMRVSMAERRFAAVVLVACGAALLAAAYGTGSAPDPSSARPAKTDPGTARGGAVALAERVALALTAGRAPVPGLDPPLAVELSRVAATESPGHVAGRLAVTGAEVLGSPGPGALWVVVTLSGAAGRLSVLETLQRGPSGWTVTGLPGLEPQP